MTDSADQPIPNDPLDQFTELFIRSERNVLESLLKVLDRQPEPTLSDVRELIASRLKAIAASGYRTGTDEADEEAGNETPAPKKPRWLSRMPEEQRKQFASKGGKAAHAAGRAHKFTSETATLAGKVGGAKTGANRERMAEIGRRGGQARRKKPVAALTATDATTDSTGKAHEK